MSNLFLVYLTTPYDFINILPVMSGKGVKRNTLVPQNGPSNVHPALDLGPFVLHLFPLRLGANLHHFLIFAVSFSV